MQRTMMALMLIFGSAGASATDAALVNEMQALDTAMFDSFNRCTDAEAFRTHRSFFAEDLEFYHDNAGVTWTRETMLANTRNNACGNYTRELIQGSFAAYPVPGFGAISEGWHRFCEVKTGQCTGKARFVGIWRKAPDAEQGWQLTRVLSYAHQPL